MAVNGKRDVVDGLRRPKKKVFKIDMFRDDWSQTLDLEPMTTHEAIMTVEEWMQAMHQKIAGQMPFNQALSETVEITIRLCMLEEEGGDL